MPQSCSGCRSRLAPLKGCCHMTQSRARAAATLAVVVLIAATAVLTGAVQGSPVPQPAARTVDAEHARLTAMIGTWDVDMTLWLRPGGAGVATKGTSTIRPLFDGLFIEEKLEATLNGAPFTTLAWTGFNPGTHQYEATRISGSSPARMAEAGVYDEAAKQFVLKADYALAGDTWHQRTVIQMVSQDAMVATSYLSFGTVPEWKAVEIKNGRKAR